MPNMTAMVDLVMCILIFFMMAADFESGTWLPGKFEAAGFAKRTPSSDLKVDVHVRIVWNGGRPTAEVTSGGTAKRFPVSARPAGLVAELTALRGRMSKDCRVVLKPDGELDYQDIASVFNAVRDSGFDHIAFAVPTETRPVAPTIFQRPAGGA